MLESFNVSNEMKYQKLSPEEQSQRGILGRLTGPIADFKNPTRNGRRYTEKLWEKVFNNPIIKEKLDNRCLFGELGHPADRQEIDMEKIAICLAEVPKKGTDGKLYGIFDILSTPNGRILKALCDYGCKIGVSSRGTGDTFTDYDGGETVEEDSYDCECWDAVIIPAVKDARMVLIKESLETGKTLKKVLQEELENSSEDDRRVMTQTLEELEIDYTTNQENEENIPEKVDNIDVTNEESQAANDDGAETIQALQEALKREKDLEKEIKSLQEKLSVCYTKEARYSNALGLIKNQLEEAKTTNLKLESQISTLNESIEAEKEVVKNKDQEIRELNEKLSKSSSRRKALVEDVSNKDAIISKHVTKIKSLETLCESHTKKQTELENANKKLTEELKDVKKDSQIIRGQATAATQRAQQLVEKYKNIAKTAVDKYIASKAHSLGISVSDIKGRLNENYSFNDIDRVCEDLQKYKLAVNSLPFGVAQKPASTVRMKIKESKETIYAEDETFNADDNIDATLLNIVK